MKIDHPLSGVNACAVPIWVVMRCDFEPFSNGTISISGRTSTTMDLG